MNPQDHDPQQFQDLAQQLARQFVTMRQQRTNNATPSQSSNGNANAGASEITNLAKQLGGLLNARETTKHAPTQEENDAFRITTAASMPSATSATSTIEVAGSAAHDFDSIPDPSMYEADFVNIFKGINASVLRFEERELLVRTWTRVCAIAARRRERAILENRDSEKGFSTKDKIKMSTCGEACSWLLHLSSLSRIGSGEWSDAYWSILRGSWSHGGWISWRQHWRYCHSACELMDCVALMRCRSQASTEYDGSTLVLIYHPFLARLQWYTNYI